MGKGKISMELTEQQKAYLIEGINPDGLELMTAEPRRFGRTYIIIRDKDTNQYFKTFYSTEVSKESKAWEYTWLDHMIPVIPVEQKTIVYVEQKIAERNKT